MNYQKIQDEAKIKELEQASAGTDPAVEAYIDQLEHTIKALLEEIIRIKDLSKQSINKEEFIDATMEFFNDKQNYGLPMYTANQISLICDFINDLAERLFGEKGDIQCK